MTPYEALCRQTPLKTMTYEERSAKFIEVDQQVRQRDIVVQELKKNLAKGTKLDEANLWQA